MARSRLADLTQEARALLEAIVIAHFDIIGWPEDRSRKVSIAHTLDLVDKGFIEIHQYGRGPGSTFKLQITDKGRIHLAELLCIGGRYA